MQKNIKKILLVGFFYKNKNNYAYAESFYDKFLKLGYVVETFNTGLNIFPLLKINNLLINILFYKKVKQFNPDLIFFIKAENIDYRFINRISKKGYLTVNFYPDNPFVFWNGNSNKNILNLLPSYNYFLSWSKLLIPILQMAGAKNVYYFPFAYDKDVYEKKIELINLDQKKYKSDVSFAGTWDAQREEWLTKLINFLPYLDLSIWGNNWQENLPSDSILKKFLKGNAVYRDELIKLSMLSKITLNFIRKQNMTSHNMRTLEVPAMGGFLLTQRTEEQSEFLFKEGESIECFSSIQELAEKIKFYLNNEKQRNYIAVNSKKRAEKFELESVLGEFMKFIQNNHQEGD
ncbi:MAG: glycosyltransferase [bacterium]